MRLNAMMSNKRKPRKPVKPLTYGVQASSPCKLGGSKKGNGNGFNKEDKVNNNTLSSKQKPEEPTRSNAVSKYSKVAKEWCQEHTVQLFQNLTDAEDNYYLIKKEMLLGDQRSHEAICYELVEYGLAVSTTMTEDGIRCKIREESQTIVAENKPEKPTESNVVLNFTGVAKEWCEEHTAPLFQKIADAENDCFLIEKEMLLDDQRSYEAICQELVAYGLVVGTTITAEGIHCKTKE